MSKDNTLNTLLEKIREGLILYRGTVGEPVSLSDVGKLTRVEPITVVSQDLASLPELYDILHGFLNIYAAYYLQAVSLLSVELQDVRVLKILDRLNPDRDIKTMLTAGTGYGNESRSFSTDTPSDFSFEDRDPATLSLDGATFKLPGFGDQPEELGISSESKNTDRQTSVSKVDYLEKLPFAVGKLVDVNFSFNCQKTDKGTVCSESNIPVLIKLDTIQVPKDAVSSIVTLNEDEITFGNRFKKAMAGRISFIKDFILCQDLITESKKTMMRDISKTYSRIMRRINNSRLYSSLTGNISMNAVSSIMVISEEVEKTIERRLGDTLSNRRVRDMVFNNTSAMVIAVVDREWDRVTIYMKGNDGHTHNSFSDFKSQSNTDSMSTITDLLKAFTMGNPPSF